MDPVCETNYTGYEVMVMVLDSVTVVPWDSELAVAPSDYFEVMGKPSLFILSNESPVYDTNIFFFCERRVNMQNGCLQYLDTNFIHIFRETYIFHNDNVSIFTQLIVFRTIIHFYTCLMPQHNCSNYTRN